MSVTSVSDYIAALRESQVLEPGVLDEITRNAPPAPDDVQAFARDLVERGLLTAYQAEQLREGRGRDLVIGPYRLLEPLGEGGMGQVFKALQYRLNRLVALKVIRQERLAGDPEVIRRFRREARAAAQLSHPNVVLLYDADQAGDRHFLAMEYVEGTDLARLVREQGPLPVEQGCAFIRQAALGLQHAFECGMVHRDVKPSNLLVTMPRPTRGLSGVLRGATPAATAGEGENPPAPVGAAEPTTPSAKAPVPIPRGSQIKILDMGLARLIERERDTSAHSLTQEGAVMGTPDYIAPEQARDARNADIRSDLYSLGCTFYFLLAGRPPFLEGTVIEKLLMHQLDEPAPLEETRPDVPAEVAVVVRKLMAKRPEDRYQTPAEVAEALEFLPTVSIPAPQVQPQAGDTIGPPSTALVQVLPASPPSTEKPEAEKSPVPTAASVYHWRGTGSDVVPTSAAKEINRMAVFRGHRGWVTATAFSPDRTVLVSGGVDGTIRLWTFSKTKPRDLVFPTIHRGEVTSLAFAPNGKRLASGSGSLDGLVWFWTLSGGEPVKRVGLAGHTAAVEAMVFSPHAKVLATGSCDRSVRLWDVSGSQPREWTVLKGHTDYVKALAFSPNGKLLASGSQDGTVRLWSIGKLWCAEQAVIESRAGHVRCVAFAPDGQALAFGCMDESVRLWDLTGSRPKERLVLGNNQGVVRLVLSPPDGNTLLSVGDRGWVTLWDVVAGSRLREWVLGSTMICSLTATHDGRYLATGTSDGSVSVFRLYPKRSRERG